MPAVNICGARGASAMSELHPGFEFLRDPRISVHATSPLATWLWSPDGSKILWANAVGAAVFGTPSPDALINQQFDSTNPILAVSVQP